MRKDKQGAENPETRAARLLLALIDGKKLSVADYRWLDKNHRMGFDWTRSGGSWNIPQVTNAAALWADPTWGSWWTAYLRCQLGESQHGDHPPGEPGDPLYCFNGTESGSNTYEGWRWGAVLAVRLWALRHPDKLSVAELLRLTARYSEVQTALLALGAAPGPTLAGSVLSPDGASEVRPHAHRTGRQTWWPGPSLPMSGNRSTPAHLGTDERMPLYSCCAPRPLGISSARLDRFGWPTEILLDLITQNVRLATGTVGMETGAALAGIRLLVPHHFLRWDAEGVRVNYMERLGNFNTTSIMGHVHYDKENRAAYLFPWPGRLRGGLGEADCGVGTGTGRRQELVRLLVARSRFGEVSCDLPSRDSDSHVVVGPDGLKVLA